MLRKIIPHINLILIIVTLTMFILTRYNPGILNMAFYSVCMYLFFASSFILTIITLIRNSRE